ncbi:hypothetical protein ACTFIV_006916 [Dictyostelium citrinum]
MYTFNDKSERSMTLRPEGTAAALRAYCEKKLYQIPGSSKLYYIGPMFRYERPQAGRYRQHHQFGAEALGILGAEQDAEMIDFLCEIYRRVWGLTHLVVHLNSVGDEETRSNYRHALEAFLRPYFDKLSAESQVPEGSSSSSKSSFDLGLFIKKRLMTILKRLNVFLINSKFLLSSTLSSLEALITTIKRFLEIISHGLGAQNTIGAGGRYDGLLETLGGPCLPASVGFATGLEKKEKEFRVDIDLLEKETSAWPSAGYFLKCNLLHHLEAIDELTSGSVEVKQMKQRTSSLTQDFIGSCVTLSGWVHKRLRSWRTTLHRSSRPFWANAACL